MGTFVLRLLEHPCQKEGFYQSVKSRCFLLSHIQHEIKAADKHFSATTSPAQNELIAPNTVESVPGSSLRCILDLHQMLPLAGQLSARRIFQSHNPSRR